MQILNTKPRSFIPTLAHLSCPSTSNNALPPRYGTTISPSHCNMTGLISCWRWETWKWRKIHKGASFWTGSWRTGQDFHQWEKKECPRRQGHSRKGKGLNLCLGPIRGARSGLLCHWFTGFPPTYSLCSFLWLIRVRAFRHFVVSLPSVSCPVATPISVYKLQEQTWDPSWHFQPSPPFPVPIWPWIPALMPLHNSS